MISCRQHYLPREFSFVFFGAVYIPPQTEAGTKTTLNELYSAISKQENTHPEAALLVAGDFNTGKLKSVLPNFYQHVKCATRRKKTLDHLYSTHRDAYKALPRPPSGKSDHNSILLIPANKKK
jgi:endonuclease/exonuclease/phosphatase (EEP) superfamily protein YafD